MKTKHHTKGIGKRLLKFLYPMGALVMMAALAFTMARPAAAAVYESYMSGDEGHAFGFKGSSWMFQSFTTTSAHNLNAVNLKLFRDSSYSGNVRVSIRATASGVPTGGDLCAATINVSTVTTSRAWYQIPMNSTIPLSNGTMYAICMFIDWDPNDFFYWCADIESSTYDGGTAGFGDTGEKFTDKDCMFEIQEIATNTVTVIAGDGGTVTPGTGQIPLGGSPTYTSTPNTGYILDDVLLDSVSQGRSNLLTLNNVTAPHTVEAVFNGGWSQPSGGANNSVSDFANAYSSNDSWATFNAFNDWADYWGFGLNSIPAGATINGIEVAVEGKRSLGGMDTIFVSLWHSTRNTMAPTSYMLNSFPTADRTFIVGGSSDLWGRGAGAWQPSDFTDANFKIRIATPPSSEDDTVYIDQVQVKVHYTPPARVAVGGEAYPVNKVSLIAPWIAFAVIIAAGGIFLVRPRAHN